MKIKRILAMLVAVFMVASVAACGPAANPSSPASTPDNSTPSTTPDPAPADDGSITLWTYPIGNWGQETEVKKLTDAFTAETGIKVNYTTFSTNEEVYARLRNGGASYDVIVPSDYMIERLISEDYLQKLDHSKLDCMDKLTDAVKNLSYDPGNEYSVPYFWGTVGIVYDKTKVDVEDLEREGYNIFLNEKYRGDIYLYDSERDTFMMALKALGYSMNSENEKELEEAAMIDGCTPLKTFFSVVLPIMKPTYISVGILETMWIWNDFLLPYLVLDLNKYKTISIAIQYMKGSYGRVDMGAIMAALILAVIPVIIFYLSCQKHIIKGVAAGAVKG